MFRVGVVLPKGTLICDLQYFCTSAVLSPKMAPRGPKMAPRGLKMSPSWPKMAPRDPKMAPSCSQDGLRWAQDAPKDLPLAELSNMILCGDASSEGLFCPRFAAQVPQGLAYSIHVLTMISARDPESYHSVAIPDSWQLCFDCTCTGSLLQ